MKRNVLLLLALVAVGWTAFPGPLQAARSFVKVPVGAVAAHLVGRLAGSNGAHGDFEFIGYVSFVESADLPLFAGPPSEHTAHLTFRSDPYRLTAIPNGSLWHVARLADPNGPLPAVRLYFNPTPGADFAQPDSFSNGQLIGALLGRGTQGLLIPSVMFHLEGSVSVVKPLDGHAFDLRELAQAATITFVGTPPSLTEFLTATKFSVPFSAVVVAAERFHKP